MHQNRHMVIDDIVYGINRRCSSSVSASMPATISGPSWKPSSPRRSAWAGPGSCTALPASTGAVKPRPWSTASRSRAACSPSTSGPQRVFPYVLTCGPVQRRGAKASRTRSRILGRDDQGALAALPPRRGFLAKVEGTSASSRLDHEPRLAARTGRSPSRHHYYRLLGDVTGSIGVTLSDSFVILPTSAYRASSSRPTTTLQNCRYCQREACRTGAPRSIRACSSADIANQHGHA